MFGAVKLTKNADPDKYKHNGYGIRFDLRSQFSSSDGTWGKNVIIFGANMSLSVHGDNKNKDILVLGQHQDDTTLTAEAKHLLILQNQEKDLLSLH